MNQVTAFAETSTATSTETPEVLERSAVRAAPALTGYCVALGAGLVFMWLSGGLWFWLPINAAVAALTIATAYVYGEAKGLRETYNVLVSCEAVVDQAIAWVNAEKARTGQVGKKASDEAQRVQH